MIQRGILYLLIPEKGLMRIFRLIEVGFRYAAPTSIHRQKGSWLRYTSPTSA